MSKNYKQYDTRWAKLGYPKKPWYIRDCGCGEVAICNSIDKSEKYKDETPKTILPYCRQFAAPNGDGTYWDAPPTMMKHYGMTEVMEHRTMSPLWKELAKGGRVAVYMMSNRTAGKQGLKWTGSKHFICSVAYRFRDGKHEVYIKDSNSDSKSKNGWHAYEDVLRNAVFKVWSGKLPATATKDTPLQKFRKGVVSWAKKIAKDNTFKYVHWKKNDAKTKQCPICHNFPKNSKYHGFYCTRFPYSAWKHGGGLKINCDSAPNNGQIDKIYNAKTDAEALKLARKYFKIHDLKVIRNKKGSIPQSKLKPADACYYFSDGSCQHAFLYIGNGKMIDANSVKDGIAERKAMSCRVAVRYIGK